ncbi:oxidoreductase family protein [Nevskia sp.]|uniref:oxidoreductase family protein n=1 Tax=Nevskia sp. TaxID=1929292 RepID=UPI0025F25791|nr:oxidoreductase family protein [Nevskia sp.]
MTEALAIVTPDQVTPAWITQALLQRGVDASVESLRMEQVGTGQLGETRRFHLQYKGAPPPEAPKSVVGKFPSANAVAAESGKTMGFYRSEVMFYRELAHRAKIRTPTVYVAEIDQANDFTLLLEDMAPARQGDQFKGCTLDEARRALKEAALLHAAFWNDRELMAQPWLYVPEGAQGFYTTELIERSWDHVCKHYTEYLTPEFKRVGDKYVRNHAYWNRPREFPKCFSHNDFRPDNMLFGGPNDRICVVDWQTSNFLGSGMDVAYFLSGIFDRQTRKTHERALLKEYHEDLLRHGVHDYSFDHLLRDYAHYSFAVIAVAIAATLIVKRTERGDKMLMHMAIGGALQALDNEALDDLPD